MKIVTWNVNSLNVRLHDVMNYLMKTRPDILVLQELKMDHNKFPIVALENIGYRATWFGQSTYNGVAVISQMKPTEVVRGMPNYPDEQSRVIKCMIGDSCIVGIYAVNGENIRSEKFQYKLQWYQALIDYLNDLKKQYSKIFLLGDFNIAPYDIDCYQPDFFKHEILSTPQERAIFHSILELGFVDLIRDVIGNNLFYTWFDYRGNAFLNNYGVRIDHILCTKEYAQEINFVGVDLDERARERPSDHAPVWVKD